MINGLPTCLRGSTKTRNVERRNVEHWNGKPETRNRKRGTQEQKTRNAETVERKTWNAGTENPERRNRKHGTHFLPDFISYEENARIAIFL